MPTMNVSLPPELAGFVEAEVASGAYGTASEVVRDGLRLLLREKALRDETLAVLRRELARGIAEAEGGALSPRSIADIARDVAAEPAGG